MPNYRIKPKYGQFVVQRKHFGFLWIDECISFASDAPATFEEIEDAKKFINNLIEDKRVSELLAKDGPVYYP